MINKDLIEEACSRCNEIETWEHVIKCDQTKPMRKEFITNLLKDLFDNKEDAVHFEEIFKMIEDVLRYLENEEEEEFKTNQRLVGIQQLFRGYIIKV